MAVEVLKARGVPEHRILFLNLIASPQGIKRFASRFPRLRVVTAFVDQGLDEKKYATGSFEMIHVATLTEAFTATSSQDLVISVIDSTPSKR